MHSLDELHSQFTDGLEKVYDRREVESIAKIVFDHLDINYNKVLTKEEIELEAAKKIAQKMGVAEHVVLDID